MPPRRATRRRRKPKEPPDSPIRFEEAVREFRKRLPMTDAQYEELDAAAREHAFKVAGVTTADVAQTVFSALDRAIADGSTLEDFKAEAGASLAEAWGGEDSGRVETVFRTNVNSAYNAGRHQVFSAPTVQKSRPYWRFDATMDSRTSDVCEQCDGTVLPADDPFWRKFSPPLHPNCRSYLVALTAEEAGDEGLTDGEPNLDAEPADGFGKRPSGKGIDWKPDPDRFDPLIRPAVAKRIG